MENKPEQVAPTRTLHADHTREHGDRSDTFYKGRLCKTYATIKKKGRTEVITQERIRERERERERE